ncbi:MAG: putative PEP-binding protein, partial [bacterium]
LVRTVTTTEDIKGLAAASGVLTTHGGKTSHAAVVARGMGKPCITGCESIQIDPDNKCFKAGDVTVRENDLVTIDGSTGRVFLGTIPMRKAMISPEFRELLHWADETRTLRIRSNADTPEDAAKAREFGAEGIGLCRTEQMLMAPDRLPTVRAMIMAEAQDERMAHLDMLADMHRVDFLEIFESMQGLPVTIRLIDPPLHEFLPPLHTLLMEVAVMRSQGVPGAELRQREDLVRKVHSLREDNPMLGLRGCRLGLLYPDIIRMQVEAIFQAACTLAKRGGDVRPEILIPFVSHVNEVKMVRKLIDESAQKIIQAEGVNVPYTVGILIEIPRAALTAAALAEVVDSFSFGTNDLTQTTFGISRDDAESKFLYYYLDQKILARNPFETVDIEGVGRLMRIAVEDGRRANPNLTMGLSGEQGGERDTVLFCHALGLDYISCSTYRLPVARLAAAQAKLLENRGELDIDKPNR